MFCLPKKTPILFPSAGEQCEEVHVVVKALKGLLEKKQKKAKELTQEQYLREFRASKEVQILKKLEEEVYQLDASLHCEMEADIPPSLTCSSQPLLSQGEDLQSRTWHVPSSKITFLSIPAL